ncbi:hypothetical protein A1O1_08117 [Capronia coronata CBS 617.96]|uniref:Xylanolytic transcriptional activator regulatory domain-containing protein n=1 Tax=Capronia coronata CBS 617.96 TaxID=1182541 RepID=W9XPA5_9EURO|nr:uncharacterized protein A1O1_08117 [Capronia coronata CBS 617.96]EXJ82048.1 hypothetical protein A1O1_08117 [Capronia coronata CBS 617.96]
MESEEFASPPTVSSLENADENNPATQGSKPARRPRVSLACQRCKHRKQRVGAAPEVESNNCLTTIQCNGDQPSCARCLRLKLECHYVIPSFPKPAQAKSYIKALEDRVAELEKLLTKEGDRTVSRDHWDDLEGRADDSDAGEEGGIQPLLNAVRDLSLDVAGSYVGGASAITLGRALQATLAGKIQLTLPNLGLDDGDLRREVPLAGNLGTFSGADSFQLSKLNPEIADQMVYGYLKHLTTNFPIILSTDILDLHSRRQNLNDVYEESILSLIYGLGGHFLEKTGESTYFFNPEMYYYAALENREAILRLGDTRSLTYLMLLGQHCYRMPKEPGAWTFFGLAMKICIELGLHRQRRSARISVKSETNKRIFWTCYWHERESAMAMGRPPAISDHDIDVELPLDVDEATRDVEVLRKAAEQDRSIPAYPQTTMSTIIHLLRLKKIESEIQHEIYRVDRTKPSSAIHAITDAFLEKLYAWKDAIPAQSIQLDSGEPRNLKSDMASYYKTLRVLLQPRLYEKVVDGRYFALCVEACRGMCETYRRLHDRLPIAFTSLSLQSVCLSGLTLVYCMWHDSSSSMSFRNLSALTDCSIILYVMAERWPPSRKYRDLFEAVKKSVIQAIEEGKHIPRTAVTSMKGDMQKPLQSLHDDTPMDSVTDDLQQMISDMTGETISFWDDTNIGMDDASAVPAAQLDDRLKIPGIVGWTPADETFWYNNGYIPGPHES